MVKKMKEVGAVIGGEGNGGIIYPELHYGRDALVGIALFLSHLSLSGLSCSELRYKYPEYYISKNRVDLPSGIDPDRILDKLAMDYKESIASREDGILLEYPAGWVQIRRSNTEPIIRVYSEGATSQEASEFSSNALLEKCLKELAGQPQHKPFGLHHFGDSILLLRGLLREQVTFVG